ncbi:hypothetical protein [Sporosarcina sp. D27]|uniref:hypothetical protein n=1 Tax=Sporosarcina sp. D27 TaxID=1382305 RepID=UPI00046F7971|nr:hypothetical protein [Sporosarcina sp. D27]
MIEKLVTTDKRNKTCGSCGKPFRDNTRPNNKKACSTVCGDVLRKQRQRNQYAADTAHIVRKPSQYDFYKSLDLEYPFWGAKPMQNLTQRIESLQPTDKVERIMAAQQREALIGGKRKQTETISYDGDEKGGHGVSVRFAEHDDKEPGPVTTTKMTAEEMDRYFAETYVRKK